MAKFHLETSFCVYCGKHSRKMDLCAQTMMPIMTRKRLQTSGDRDRWVNQYMCCVACARHSKLLWSIVARYKRKFGSFVRKIIVPLLRSTSVYDPKSSASIRCNRLQVYLKFVDCYFWSSNEMARGFMQMSWEALCRWNGMAQAANIIIFLHIWNKIK